MSKQIVAVTLAVTMALAPCTPLGEVAALAQGGTADQQAMDKLLAPIALYPDALLAQTLACATSPDQVHEVSEWLNKNSQLQGSDLQKAAEQAGFDASFVAIVLFPDVLKLLEDNKQWTTELGKAFLSDQKAVLASAQRLREQAKSVGNLKTTAQQEVKTESSGGQQVIVIQPANPQVVYVPQYNPQTVYTSPPPQQEQQSSSSGASAAAGLIGFTAGIVLGAALSNDNYGYYGWGAWGCGWHTNAVVVRGGPWRVPPVPRYPYTRPVYGYRAPANVYAPRYSNVNANRNVNRNVNASRNVNVNNVNVNVNPQNRTVNNTANNLSRTPRPTAATSTRTTRPAQSTAATRQSRSTAGVSDYASRGGSLGSPSSSPSPARQMESGSRTSAFSGYQNGAAERQASSRGSRSSSSGGGSRRRQ
jgi:uncharacterized protein DUF3300